MKQPAKVGRPPLDGQSILYGFHAGQTLVRKVNAYHKREKQRTGHDIPRSIILRHLIEKGLEA